MLHESIRQFDHVQTPHLDAEGRPIFDAAAYIDAMRAVGAILHPVRGTPGGIDLDGGFTVEMPIGGAERRRVDAIEVCYAPGRKADPVADGRVAQALLTEAATQRFVAVVGKDMDLALQEIARLDQESVAASKRCDHEVNSPASERAADIAGENFHAAFDCMLAMPIRRKKDIVLKAEFGLRYCDLESQHETVLADIAIFRSRERVGTLPEIHPIAPISPQGAYPLVPAEMLG